MKCWLAHTWAIAAWICAASGRYCSFRSSSGTCMAGLDSVAFTGDLRRSALVAVVAAEPVDEILHPNLDRRRRPIAHVPHQVIDIGAGFRDVPGLQREKILLRLPAQ